MPRKKKWTTDTELVVMSLLMEKPMYGYQIEQTIVDRGMREWTTIGFSSIYYVLEKLEKKEWITSVIEIGDGKGPARKIYSITNNGKIYWKNQILDALAHPSKNNNNFLLALSTLEYLDKQSTISALENYHNELSKKLNDLEKKQEGFLPWNVIAMFDFSKTQIQAELNWLTKFLAQILKRNSE
jgi:DNA-binding PadR family transcriptional regulator